MKSALNLVALAQTFSAWLDDDTVTFNEEDGYLSFDQLEPEKGLGPIQPRSHTYRLKTPVTIREAFNWAVEAEIVEDNLEEWEDFLWTYKHFEKLPARMLNLGGRRSVEAVPT